jgi:arginine decarboxylase
LITGNRLPFQYFFSTGAGESDYGGKGNPYEAGSYDGALNEAGIENFNIIQYTSILPKQARELTRKQAMSSGITPFGSVMEAIFAKMDGTKGQTITASLLVTRILDKKEKILGSFCTEYMGHGNENEARETLLHDTEEMIIRRGYGDCTLSMHKKCKGSTGYTFEPTRFYSKTLKVKKRFGTVIAGLFFINYMHPIVGKVLT